MKKIPAISLVLTVLSTAAHADISLIATGQIDASVRDLSARTSTALESGEPGNLQGGMSSGLTYAGGNTYLCIPDRGPNASTYNADIDNTTSYIPRFHSVQIDTIANPDYDPMVTGSLPFLMNLHTTSTTLLSTKNPLFYAAGGAPALNSKGKNYFSGRSDNFNSLTLSTSQLDGRLDPESIRVSNKGKDIFISDEYGPYVYKFNRSTGLRSTVYTLPAHYAVTNKVAYEKTASGEIAMNATGRTTNKGMEGLAITPDGKSLVGIMQANLIQDTKKYLRIAKINLKNKSVKEYAYLLTDGTGVSEILAVSNDKFLVLERDGKGLGDNSNATAKKIYMIDLATATEVTGAATIDASSPVVSKTLFLDIVAALSANGMNVADIPSKMEGITFGPDITIGDETKHTLLLGNDNDFLPTITDSLHPTGIQNPNQFFMFAISPSDLPGFIPQVIKPNPLDQHDRG